MKKSASRCVLLCFASLSGLVLPSLACSSLTAPPSPEPIASEAPLAAKPAPSASVAANIPTAHASAAPVPSAAPLPPLDPNAKLEMKDLTVGKGAAAKTGDKVTVHYVGTLQDGKKFDASKDHGKPFDFTLGEGQVIKGWDQGVVGMKVGGKRKLTIPSQLAYGDQGRPPVIPQRATLVFEVELLAINGK
ncbi:MAG: Periplasmic thiol:disulfide interchange protein DsbA [Myxococcaceae bacterium]|nr:Periplasmic thiol:disulfide interchange protein DsbA [Myxococcaceae bacterium]